MVNQFTEEADFRFSVAAYVQYGKSRSATGNYYECVPRRIAFSELQNYEEETMCDVYGRRYSMIIKHLMEQKPDHTWVRRRK